MNKKHEITGIPALIIILLGLLGLIDVFERMFSAIS